jgi:archaellum component FlaF (FlaF/FlaG flagellin family)
MSADVSLTFGPANFASKNAGTWTVTATGLGLSGADAGNYVLASTTAQTTARILARSLDAVLSTASTINIAKNGSITFKLSSLNGIVDGQTVAELFDGVQFSIMIGSTRYSGTSTASVVGGTISVSWRMNAELYTDLYSLLNGGTPSSKTTIDLKLYATSLDGNYTLSEDVLTSIFQRGNVTFS